MWQNGSIAQTAEQIAARNKELAAMPHFNPRCHYGNYLYVSIDFMKTMEEAVKLFTRVKPKDNE